MPPSEEFKLVRQWAEVLEELRKVSPHVSGALDGSGAFSAGGYLMIVAKNRFFMQLFKQPENNEVLRGVVSKVLGQNYSVRVKIVETEAPQNASKAAEVAARAQEMGLEVTRD